MDVSRLPDEQETTEFYMACGVPEERAAQIAQCFELKKDILLEFQNADADWFSMQKYNLTDRLWGFSLDKQLSFARGLDGLWSVAAFLGSSQSFFIFSMPPTFVKRNRLAGKISFGKWRGLLPYWERNKNHKK